MTRDIQAIADRLTPWVAAQVAAATAPLQDRLRALETRNRAIQRAAAILDDRIARARVEFAATIAAEDHADDLMDAWQTCVDAWRFQTLRHIAAGIDDLYGDIVR